MNGRPIRPINSGDFGDRKAVVSDGTGGSSPDIQSRILRNPQRSVAHRELLSSVN
jgi:hypothetical protein